MAVPNVPLLSRIVIYVIGLLLSLLILVPLSLQLDDFQGKCLLFSEGAWSEDDKMMTVHWASAYNCYYVLFVGGLAAIVCLIQAFRLLTLWTDRRNTSFLATFLEAAGCTLLAALVISAGIIITLGFSTWCQTVSLWFPSCEDLAGLKIQDATDELSSEWFYLQLDLAQFGAWSLQTALVALAVLSCLRCLQLHQILNIHSVMPHNERTPLLNSGFPEDGCPAPADQA